AVLRLATDILVTSEGVQTVSPSTEFTPECSRPALARMVVVPFLLSRDALSTMYTIWLRKIIDLPCSRGPRTWAVTVLHPTGSNAARMVTGASYTMDGGWSAR